MRQHDVATLAGVPLSQVHQIAYTEVAQAFADTTADTVLECLEQAPATYWRVGDHYYFDDPYFGDVVDIALLDYNDDLGLYIRDE